MPLFVTACTFACDTLSRAIKLANAGGERMTMQASEIGLCYRLHSISWIFNSCRVPNLINAYTNKRGRPFATQRRTWIPPRKTACGRVAWGLGVSHFWLTAHHISGAAGTRGGAGEKGASN